MFNKSIIIAVATLALLPLLVLAFFNQPAGDDMWYTWMARQYGFFKVQHQWFVSINGRYTSNIFMSLNSWVYGSVLGFKIWPVAVMLLWVAAIYTLLNRLPGSSMDRSNRFAIAILAVLAYYLNMPGLYEGAYWMSAVTGYQLPLLLYISCWLIITAPALQPWWKKYLLLPLLLFIAGGFHEIITFSVCILAFYTILIRHYLSKPIAKWVLAFVVSGLALLIQLLSIGNQYKANTTESEVLEKWSLGKVVLQSILQTGYHITIHCLLSPLFWMLILLSWLVGFRFVRPYYQPALPFRKNTMLITITILPLTFLPGLPIVYLYNNVAPLRIMNLSCFFWMTGSIVIAVLVGVHQGKQPFFYSLIQKSKRNTAITAILLVGCIVFSSNERQVLTALVNGSARQYNQEVQSRFCTIKNCPEKICAISSLVHQPAILCPIDVSQDTTLLNHLEKVFGKKLLILP